MFVGGKIEFIIKNYNKVKDLLKKVIIHILTSK